MCIICRTNDYEVTSDAQLPASLFLASFPEEYAAFKEPLAAAWLG